MSDVVLLMKRSEWCAKAAEIAGGLLGDLTVLSGDTGDAFPAQLETAQPKCLISFLSPWIVPESILRRSATAINFHPASVEYPGIGCYNFALYEDAREYGALCHRMAPKVDTGAIVEERRFPVFARDTVETLKLRTMVVMLDMFHGIVCRLAGGEPLPQSPATWSRRPFTRRELDDLCRITADMDAAEIRRRVRATTYPGRPGPSIVLGGISFAAPVPNRPPIA